MARMERRRETESEMLELRQTMLSLFMSIAGGVSWEEALSRA